MKIRTGFISNSSSSSFVIIDASTGYVDFNSSLSFGFEGRTEFGWGPEVLRDVHSKINFAYLQAIKNPKNIKMLEEVIHKYTGSNKEIVWNITDEYDCKNKVYGYVDHASSAEEGKNLEIFKNKKALKDFLFGHKSKIILDNDNH